MSLIDPESIPRLARAYPREAVRLKHRLAAEPLLAHAALAGAARALPAADVETRVHNARNGEAFRLVAHAGDTAAMIEAGGSCEHWIMLRDIQRLPAYAALLDRLLAELAPAIVPAAGTPRAVRGFVFVSAPATHTPLHFDAEYNILFQISGTKRFATFPAAPPILGLAAREAYHRAGENMLGWDPCFAASAHEHALAPGDALFVPHAAPHRVDAGETPSISLSLTWQSRASRAEAEALALNPLLRRVGLPAYDPARSARVPWLRAAASRIGQRMGVV